ncbi:MAG: hypothetical protein K0B11_22335 [Mariniphaga sp.]|nr:hypothetical protein [Mariniphaga sp.]
MLQAGKCIYQTNDPLTKVSPEYLYHAVKNPKPAVASAIRQLRLVKNIDTKRYQVLKRDLPYVVTGIFHPAVRRTENFAWASHFMLDIDHLSVKEITPGQLKTKLAADARILLMFASPGEDGLKILFRLNEKMYDAARYSLFYRAFVDKFSAQYQLHQVADTRTSDVTRACFVSCDPEAFYNPDAETVIAENFIDFNNYLEIKQLKTELKEKEVEAKEKFPPETKPELEEEALEKIKKTLNPNFKPKREKQIFIPEEIEQVTNTLVEQMLEKGVTTTEVCAIHYGKKFKLALGRKQAEINLFYGKKGYSVVISPRNGTDSELNKICAQLMAEWLL